MKGIAGYRSRDWDSVEFIETGGADAAPTSGRVRTIEPNQLVFVGDVDLASTSGSRQLPGEWGRIGPARAPTTAEMESFEAP